jgi:predicted Zn-dependent peptidase
MEEVMNPRIRFALVVLGAFVLLTASAALAFDFSELEKAVTETTLDNGLKVIVMERHDAPLVSCITSVNVGGVDDPKEYTGISHMLEHMSFKGTSTIGTTDFKAEAKAMRVEDSLWSILRAERKKGQFADSAKLAELEAAFNNAIEGARQYVVGNAWDAKVEAQGAQGINAGTSKDNTSYYMDLPANKLELWMAMESDRFADPVLREMYRERMVIAEERLQVLENNPIRRAIDAMQSTAFSAHPYREPNVGHMSDIMNYSRDAVKAYFDKNYVPSNMVVVIVGDVNAPEVIAMAKKYFGRLKASPAPEPVATVEPEQKGERRVTLEDPAQPLFVCGFHIPSNTSPEWPTIQAIADYLGSGRTCLLNTSLVKEKKIAAFVGLYAGWPGSKYPCLAMIFSQPTPGHTNQEIEDEVFAQIKILQDSLVPADELEKIKARAKAGFIQGLNSNQGLAGSLANYQTDWRDWRQMFHELDRINAVTAEDIQRAARKYFQRTNCTIVHLNTIKS